MARRRRLLRAAAVLGAAFLSYALWRPPRRPPTPDAPLSLSEPQESRPGAAGAPLEAGPAPAAGITNEDLHRALEEESGRLGIRVVPRQGEEERPGSYLGPRLGLPGSREQAEAAIRELAALRRGIEAGSGRRESVPVEGRTAQLLSREDASAGLAVGPREDGAGSWSGHYASAQEGQRTIETEREWKELWGGLSRDPAPEVDFSRRQAVAVFLGSRPTGGYSVKIVRIVPRRGYRLVEYREKPPSDRQSLPLWAEGPSAPYALRIVERGPLPFRFRKLP